MKAKLGIENKPSNSMNRSSLLIINFSNCVPTREAKEIGRNLFLLGLGIRIILNSFHTSGKLLYYKTPSD